MSNLGSVTSRVMQPAIYLKGLSARWLRRETGVSSHVETSFCTMSANKSSLRDCRSSFVPSVNESTAHVPLYCPRFFRGEAPVERRVKVIASSVLTCYSYVIGVYSYNQLSPAQERCPRVLMRKDTPRRRRLLVGVLPITPPPPATGLVVLSPPLSFENHLLSAGKEAA